MLEQTLNEVKAVRQIMNRLNKSNNLIARECIDIENFVIKETMSYASIIEPLIITLCMVYTKLDKKQMLHLIKKYCPNNTYTLLIQYLTENGIIDKFKTYLATSTYSYPKNKTIEGLVTDFYPQDYFQGFIWSRTIEGYDFWQEHHYRWFFKIEQMCYDNQDILNACQKLEIK